MTDPNFVNPYEQIWKTRDLRALETPLELENKLSSFERGVGRFKEQMKGTGYGLAALASQGVQNVIGENPVTQGITDWGLEGYNETTAKSQPGAIYAPKVAKVEDIKTPSDALEWGAGLLGEQLPLAGSLLLTGGIGGAVARLGANAAVKDIAGAAVGTAVKKGVEQGTLKAVEGELITDTMRKAASKALLDTTLKGAAITGFAGTAGLEGGQSFGGSIQEGAKPEDAVKSAIAVGGLNGALELLAPFVVAKKMGLGEYAKKSIADIISNDADLSKKAIALATAKELGTRGIKGFAEGATVEGITEGLQELTAIAGERWAKNSQLFADLTDEDWSQIKNSAAGGAFIGGGLSGAGATVSGPQTEQTKVQTKITVPAQSKLDVLKANQAKLVEQINETIKAGDIKKAEELQAIKDIYDLAINKTQEVIPAQEKPVLEGELVQEPAKKTPVSEVAPAADVVIDLKSPTLTQPTEDTANTQEVQAQTEAEVKQEPLYSRPLQKPAPTFYSALERVVQEVKQEKAAPAQWESSLDNMVKKGLVKQEELDWSGTKEWLREQKEPVTKEALLQHVRDNTLEVKETLLGAGAPRVIHNPDNNQWEVYDLDGNLVGAVDGARDDSDTEVSRFGNELADLASPFYGNINYEANTRNAKWTLPGGKNQRELVLTVPSIKPFNTDDTTHYGDVGDGRAVAWVRFNDRVDENGKKTLFLEEVQSKRHQEGKAKGYTKGGIIDPNSLRIEQKVGTRGNIVWKFYDGDNYVHFVTDPEITTKEAAFEEAKLDFMENPELLERSRFEGTAVPNAPFKQTIAGSGQTLSGWAGLAFKRMLRYAVENGYDKVAWTTGEQQAKRYNLAQSVSKVAYTSDGYFQAYDRNGRVVMSSLMDENEVPNYIGKELTNELLAAPVKGGERTVEFAEDKVIGGEGMKGFYNRLLPNEINKYIKKWNTKVDKTQMKFGDESASVHSIEVTPAMRDSVMQGQPLFSKPQEALSEFKRWSHEYPVIDDPSPDNLNSIEIDGDLITKDEALYGDISDRDSMDTETAIDAVVHIFETGGLDNAIISAKNGNKKEYKWLLSNKDKIKENWNSKSHFKFETGKPFVTKVYHGSKSGEIEEFNPAKLGKNTQVPSARKGFFFAGTPETASAAFYIGEPKSGIDSALSNEDITWRFIGENIRLNKYENLNFEKFAQLDKQGIIPNGTQVMFEVIGDASDIAPITTIFARKKNDQWVINFKRKISNYEFADEKIAYDDLFSAYEAAFDEFDKNYREKIRDNPDLLKDKNPTIYPVYVRMSNPMVYDQKNKPYREISYNNLIIQAKANGHDGLVILNTTDGGPLDNIFVVFDNKNIKGYFNKGTFDETGKLLESRQNAQQPGTVTIPLQDLHANINSVMGEGWLQQAIDLGLVEVIEGPGPNGESGSWAGGKIRLYTGSVPKGSSPAGVLLHEGKHATFADVLGDSLQEYVKDLHTLAKNGNKVAQDAITHSVLAAADTLRIKHNLLNGGNRADFENLRAIIEARRPGLLAEEELAYFVQYGTEAQGGAGFLRRLINAIKAWFAQTRLGQRMKELGLGFELTDGMAVEWAKIGLNRSLAEAKQAAKVKAQVEEQAAGMSASARLGKALEVLAAVDPLYSFAGKDALTANLSLQQEAETRINNGEDKEAVRQDTGWFTGADEKWRFEISDKEASFKTPFKDIPESKLLGKQVPLDLSEVLDHPKLFKAYPALSSISVVKQSSLQAGTLGWFDDTSFTIGISPYNKDPLSSLLHEIQHVIQMYEEFARGGNENSVWKNLTEEDKLKAARDALEKNNKKLKEAQDKFDMITAFDENPDIILNYAEARRIEDIAYELYKDVENLPYGEPKKMRAYEMWKAEVARAREAEAILIDKIGQSDKKFIHELPFSSYELINKIIYNKIKDFSAYKKTIGQEIVDLYREATKIKSGDEETIRKVADMRTFYRRLAGETEARLTQARQKMTEEERKLKSPESMQEYPYNEQIVIMPGTKSSGEVFYSMGVKEFQEQLWNDPTDIRPEIVNKPGLLQKFRANFVDFFGEMEKKSKNVYDTYILQRAKKGARIEKSRQTYLLPLRELIANSPWDAKEVGDMLAARHIKIDNVNTDLAERASQGYTKELLKALPGVKQKELKQARVNVKAGKMPDGSVYKDANGNVVAMSARTKRKLMFDLMNQYAPFEIANTAGVQELNQEWEIFKDAAGGFSNGGIARGIVRTVDNVLAPVSKAPAKFDEIANLFDAMNRHTLDILEEGGLITAREHARLLTSKSAYAPLRRESYNIDQETELLFQKASAGGSKQIGTRAGTANLSEPTLVLQNALAKLEATAAAAERNLANQELYNTIMTDREGWKPWFTIADKDQYVTHDEDGFLQEKHATASNRGDIVLIKDGKKIVIQPNMHNERATGFVRAVNNMDAQTLNGPMKIMSWVNSLIRWTNISASPVFLMTNIIRDPLTAAYNLQATEAAEYSKDIFLNWKRAFKALKKVYIDNNRDLTDADVKMLEKFEKAGGRTSFVLSLKEMDDNSFSNFEGQVARRQGSMKYLMKAKDIWLDGIENYNILFENIMRFSTFMTLQEKSQGKISEQRAARIAQDITTNFSRRGYKSQMLGVWWLFFNASVQGNYQVLRNLMSSKRVQAAVGGTIATAVMLDVLGRALTDDWDEIPEWDKEKNIILPIKVGGDFVKIPAPWVYNVFWRMGGMIGETLAGKRKPQDTILDMTALTFTTLDPLGKPGSLAQAIAPTSIDPFVQILENKNFAGNPIGPEGYPGASTKANSELLWSTTPKGYQSFARFVNEVTGGSAVESGKVDLRPGDYQLLADFLTGSFGKFLTDTTFGFANKLDKGIEGPKDIPIIKEFFSDPSNSMMVQKYHTNIATIYGAHRLEQMYVKGPERDLIKLQEVREKRGNELRMYAQAQDVEKQLKSLRVKLRAAQNRKDTGREKELKERMNKVQEQFNKKFEQNVK